MLTHPPDLGSPTPKPPEPMTPGHVATGRRPLAALAIAALVLFLVGVFVSPGYFRSSGPTVEGVIEPADPDLEMIVTPRRITGPVAEQAFETAFGMRPDGSGLDDPNSMYTPGTVEWVSDVSPSRAGSATSLYTWSRGATGDAEATHCIGGMGATGGFVTCQPQDFTDPAYSAGRSESRSGSWNSVSVTALPEGSARVIVVTETGTVIGADAVGSIAYLEWPDKEGMLGGLVPGSGDRLGQAVSVTVYDIDGNTLRSSTIGQ